MSNPENYSTFKIVSDIIELYLGVPAENVKPEDTFVEKLGADSLDVVEMIMAAEEDFNLEISDEDAEKLVTVQDAVTLIDRLKS